MIPAFERLFPEHGLPGAVGTDNGNPFARAGRSRTGRQERMRLTLKAEAARPAERSMPRQQTQFDPWQRTYSDERPHETLAGAMSSSVYRPSGRPMPKAVPRPENPPYREVRRLSNADTARFQKRQFFVSKALVQEELVFEEVDDGLWGLRFCNAELARLDERDFRLRP